MCVYTACLNKLSNGNTLAKLVDVLTFFNGEIEFVATMDM